ncbi:AraC family transcriptional regulator [Pseudomonas mandelii JR-1]|uniref:AraC family transcriptional regulator n=1 Tax=Pseudomonas mandelii JR-1 TaxID=1147786 RepID=A0A024EJL3_9PSED|nr:AraC family transcriptional regulator [Pseudomonas mandelii JR-1]
MREQGGQAIHGTTPRGTYLDDLSHILDDLHPQRQRRSIAWTPYPAHTALESTESQHEPHRPPEP